MPTITASGHRLELGWIKKGKTDDTYKLIADELPDDLWSYFSESGWVNDIIFRHYIKDIVVPYLDGEPGALFVDTYGCHWTKESLEYCEKYNIELVEIPRGLTHLCQPLDVNFNGLMKQERIKIYKTKKKEGLPFIDSILNCIKRAQKAYNNVSSYNIVFLV
jgi:hypothetical protein